MGSVMGVRTASRAPAVAGICLHITLWEKYEIYTLLSHSQCNRIPSGRESEHCSDRRKHNSLPGEFLILPAGEQNTLATSNSDFCRKISCGLCGPLAVPLLHQLKLDPGRKFIIKDPETAFTMLKEINRLLFYKEKKASRIFAENVFIF